ncbi:MAG TPA: hypothetical protein G4N94_08045 [Caldilineae bacterium]|nr:hypothetical protein [Caldilineae bacterium]
MPQTALKYNAKVAANGKVELAVPLSPGTRITVFVVEEIEDVIYDLTQAAQSSLAFWDNPWDEKDWNNDTTG